MCEKGHHEVFSHEARSQGFAPSLPPLRARHSTPSTVTTSALRFSCRALRSSFLRFLSLGWFGWRSFGLRDASAAVKAAVRASCVRAAEPWAWVPAWAPPAAPVVAAAEAGAERSAVGRLPPPPRMRLCRVSGSERRFSAAVPMAKAFVNVTRRRPASGFLLETACARVGRAALLPLVDRQRNPGQRDFTEAMERSRQFFKALLGGERPRLPPLRIPVVPDAVPPILVYTDAAFSWLRQRKRGRKCQAAERRERREFVPREDPLPQPWQFNGELGMLIHDPLDSWTVVADGRPDMDTVIHYLKRERRTHIAQLEGLGILVPYYTYPGRFAGRRVVHFVDNTVAQSAVVHGYARTVDMADIANAFHLLAAGLRMAVYFDYVPSKANIADLPSRGEFGLPRALGAEVVRMRVPSHAMLTGPLVKWLDEGEQYGQDKDWPT